MHHYGVLRADVYSDSFSIIIKNNVTGAEITISGPIEGMFESRFRRLTTGNVQELANRVAQLFKESLT